MNKTRFIALMLVATLLSEPVMGAFCPIRPASLANDSAAVADIQTQAVVGRLGVAFRDLFSKPAALATLDQMPLRIRGGTASFAKKLPPIKLNEIVRDIEGSLARGAEPVPVDFSAVIDDSPVLANKLQNVRIYVLPKLSNHKDDMLAHGGVSGEAYDAKDPTHHVYRAIYFSPEGFEIYNDLPIPAQATLLIHEVLGHLEDPDADEDAIEARYSLDPVRLEVALILARKIHAAFDAAAEKLNTLASYVSTKSAGLSIPLETASKIIWKPRFHFSNEARPFRTTYAKKMLVDSSPYRDEINSLTAAGLRQDAALSYLRKLWVHILDPRLQSDVREAAETLKSVHAKALDQCLQVLYPPDAIPSTFESLMQDLEAKVDALKNPVPVGPTYVDPTMMLIYQILRWLEHDTTVKLSQIKVDVREKEDKAKVVKVAMPLLAHEWNGSRNIKLKPPVLEDKYPVQAVKGVQVPLLHDLVKATEERPKPGNRFVSIGAFADTFHTIFDEKRIRRGQKDARDLLKEHPLFEAIMFLIEHRRLPGMEPASRDKTTGRVSGRIYRDPRYREAAILLLAYDLLSPELYGRFVQERNPELGKRLSNRDEFITQLEEAYRFHARGKRNPFRKLNLMEPPELGTPPQPKSAQARAVPAQRYEPRKQSENIQYLVNNRSLLKELERMTLEPVDQIMSELASEIGHHTSKGFYVVRVLKSILSLYPNRIEKLIIRISREGHSHITKFRFVFFGSDGKLQAIALEVLANPLEFDIHPAGPDNGDGEVELIRPTFEKLAPHLKYLRGTPILRDRLPIVKKVLRQAA